MERRRATTAGGGGGGDQMSAQELQKETERLARQLDKLSRENNDRQMADVSKVSPAGCAEHAAAGPERQSSNRSNRPLSRRSSNYIALSVLSTRSQRATRRPACATTAAGETTEAAGRPDRQPDAAGGRGYPRSGRPRTHAAARQATAQHYGTKRSSCSKPRSQPATTRKTVMRQAALATPQHNAHRSR